MWLLVELSFYRKNVLVAQPVPEKPKEQIVQRYAGDRSQPCRQLACPEGKRAHQYRDKDEKPDYESFVYFWMPFLDYDFGLHDATWRWDFGGDIRFYDGWDE